MRLFQNAGISPSYKERLYGLSRGVRGFQARLEVFLRDRYGACHILLPVLQRHPDGFFTNGDDELLQREWASEHGMARDADLPAILLAQIEEHRAEVFYNLDPIRYGGAFARRLPSCVRRSICWRAAPSSGLDLSGFDALVCNFPSILERWRAQGFRAAYFAPAHDPAMDEFVGPGDRTIDVAFVGGYSRHHETRARVIEAVAGLETRYEVRLRLDRSRLTKLAETPLGRLPVLRAYRPSRAIRRTAAGPVFGRDLYSLFSKAKIVVNGAVDMAGKDRGNMRCFEAIGCGALLISDQGRYPEGFSDGENMVTYSGAGDAIDKIVSYLASWKESKRIAAAGREMLQTKYSKTAQWLSFGKLIEAL